MQRLRRKSEEKFNPLRAAGAEGQRICPSGGKEQDGKPHERNLERTNHLGRQRRSKEKQQGGENLASTAETARGELLTIGTPGEGTKRREGHPGRSNNHIPGFYREAPRFQIQGARRARDKAEQHRHTEPTRKTRREAPSTHSTEKTAQGSGRSSANTVRDAEEREGQCQSPEREGSRNHCALARRCPGRAKTDQQELATFVVTKPAATGSLRTA